MTQTNGGVGGPERPRLGIRLPGILGGAFLIAAAAGAVVTNADFRAGAEASAIVDTSVGADGAAFGWGAPSGDLRELAAARALLLDPPDLDAAEALSWNALRRSPARAGAWARLAYIDVARDGMLDAPGRDALARSYTAAPYAAEALRHWRIEFTLSRWSEVDETLRQAALREARGATAGGARWYEESVWAWDLADRLPEEPKAALLAAVSPVQ